MTRSRLSLTLFVGVAVITASICGTAYGAVTIIRTPVTGFVVTLCGSNESVALDGFLQETISLTADSAGGTHFHSTTNGQNLRGVGVTSGDRYRFAAASHSSSYIPAGSFRQATFTQTLQIVSAGSGDNDSLVITQHFTINDGGEVTADVIDVRSECRG